MTDTQPVPTKTLPINAARSQRSTTLRGRSIAQVAAMLSAVILVVLSLATPASAHTGVQSYIYLDVTESSLSGRVEAPIPDLRSALDLELEGSDEQVIDEVNDELQTIASYLNERFVFTIDGQGVPIEFTEAELFFSDADELDDNYVVFPFEVDPADTVIDGTVPRNFDLRADFFLAEIEGRENWLIIGNDWQAGVIENGFETLTRFTEAGATETIDLGEPSWVQNFTSSVKLGVNHIQTGPDHILFVLVLLLPAVLVFAGSWKPASSFGSALWRVLKIVTMFTIAHSVTFTLAGLDILPLPSPRIVESVIALSIAVAALHNIRPIFANREWLIAFVFGLFHGLGFASLISALDISRSTQLVSLLGRNVGIEIGHSIVILLLFPALFLMRRTEFYNKFMVVSSLVLAAVSVGWMIERSLEIDLGTASIVDPVFEWPRSLLIVAAITALAGLVWYRASSAGQLLEVADRSLSQDLATSKSTKANDDNDTNDGHDTDDRVLDLTKDDDLDLTTTPSENEPVV